MIFVGQFSASKPCAPMNGAGMSRVDLLLTDGLRAISCVRFHPKRTLIDASHACEVGDAMRACSLSVCQGAEELGAY